MLAILQQASLYPWHFFWCVVLAIVPVFLWMMIFLNKSTKDTFYVTLTFFWGMAGGGIILLYQYLWGAGPFNLVFFSVEALNFKQSIASMFTSGILISFWIYMGVGFLEEAIKHFAVVRADQRIFSSIDEVIELSIVAALGFSFLENVAYFYKMFLNSGLDGAFYTLALQRSVFVMFVHILCSGIYGYFYGMGYFAKPYMQYEMQRGKSFVIESIMYRILHWRPAEFFRERMAMTGLLLASVLHGLYDFALDQNPFLSMGPLSVQLHVILLPVFLFAGMWYLSTLLQKKANMEEFGEMQVEYIYRRPDAEELQKPIRESRKSSLLWDQSSSTA